MTKDELPQPKSRTPEDMKRAIAAANTFLRARKARRAELYRQHEAYIAARLELAGAWWDDIRNNIESDFDDWLRDLRQEASGDAAGV